MTDPAKNSGPRRLASPGLARPEPDHPPVERLTAYHAGELGAAEADSIQEHLAVCRECADAVLELPGFYEAMEAEELEGSPGLVPTPAETAASWQAVRARLGPSLATTAPAAPAREGWFRRLTTSRGTVYLLAACLAACLIGFPLWIWLRSPEPSGVVAAYQSGQGEVLRGPGAGKALSVGLDETGAVLVLPLPRGPVWPEYRIEVRSRSGEVRLVSAAALVPMAPGAPTGEDVQPRFVTVALARGQLAAGEYRLRILGVRGGRGEAVGEVGLRVATSASDGR